MTNLALRSVYNNEWFFQKNETFACGNDIVGDDKNGKHQSVQRSEVFYFFLLFTSFSLITVLGPESHKPVHIYF